MARIRSETGSNWADFIRAVVLIFASMISTAHLSLFLKIDQIGMPEWLDITLALLVSIVMYGVLNGLITAAFAVLARLTELVEAFTQRVAEFAEWLLTTVVEVSAAWGLKLLALPFLPLIWGARWLHRTFIATFMERRRQREELRRLYEEVKDDYNSFEDFLRDFESGGEQARQSENDRQEQQRRQKERDKPVPSPRDPFKEACVLLGLAPDGSFTQAEFKQRYTAMMKAVHPDILGQNGIAAQVNEARITIKQRKGWQ